mmetsp:Transcript_27057/g.64404  ORF Transcript_27057/g.64404 Transcript_27057/m.64404 type:complete len:210 (-) Transcript_27057:152-781(-)
MATTSTPGLNLESFCILCIESRMSSSVGISTSRVARSSTSGAVSGVSVSNSWRLRFPGRVKMSLGWKRLNGSLLAEVSASSPLLRLASASCIKSCTSKLTQKQIWAMSGCEMVDWMYSEDVELYRCASTASIATSMATSAEGSSLRGVVVPLSVAMLLAEPWCSRSKEKPLSRRTRIPARMPIASMSDGSRCSRCSIVVTPRVVNWGSS